MLVAQNSEYNNRKLCWRGVKKALRLLGHTRYWPACVHVPRQRLGTATLFVEGAGK